MFLFETVVSHVLNLILKRRFTIMCSILYAAACVWCYLTFRSDRREKERTHQGWVGRQLKRVKLKIEKNGKVVLVPR